MNRDALQHDLLQRGVPCRVEAWDRLAVLVPDTGALPLAIEELRRDVLALASKHGFTHVAIELTEDWPSGATLSRRQSD